MTEINSGWQYFNPVAINFGTGLIGQLKNFIAPSKCLLITTPGFTRRGLTELLKNSIAAFLVGVYDDVQPNPTFGSINEAFERTLPYEYDVIVAFGGGSVIDTAKALTALRATNDKGWIGDHLKAGSPFPKDFHPIPIIAIPTTAGTGSEVTSWATIWDMEEKRKYSLSHPLLYPSRAILDPELTITLDEKTTIHSGLDALSHAMEAIWNKNHNPVSDAFALEAISIVYDSLPKLKMDLTNIELRVSMLQASLKAGLAFSNTKTALAHSISYPLTTLYGIPHGLACSLPLPHLLEYNSKDNFERIAMMAEPLRAEASIEAMKSKFDDYFKKIDVSLNLADYGVSENDLKTIADLSVTPGRSDNNIAHISSDSLKSLIDKMF